MNKKIRLNRFIRNSGLCSRRKADLLIKSRKIKVNGNIVTDLGLKIFDKDIVEYKNKKLKIEEKHIYILLNKPSNCLTTAYDPQHRRTVFDLLPQKYKKKGIFPVGRLDRNTTGLLLLTNNGILAKTLMHPSSNTVKKYSLILNRGLDNSDFLKIKNGIVLSDGFFKVDEIYVDNKNNKNVSIIIHSGKNRILRRIFKFLNYKIINLDRYYYAGFEKNGLKIGEYREITI